MKGTPHYFYFESTQKDAVGVHMSNVEDDAYACTFETREEIEKFIVELRAAADKVWPLK